MKKMFAVLLVLAVILLSGCSSEVEGKLAHLEEQVNLLQDRVSALEAENELLKQQLDTPGEEIPAPEYEPVAQVLLYDWTADENRLVLEGAFVRVMSLGENVNVESCSLILTHNGQALEATALELLPGEAVDSFELELDRMDWQLPEMESADVLELYLEVFLSDGSLLTAWGGSWDFLDGVLVMIAG